MAAQLNRFWRGPEFLFPGPRGWAWGLGNKGRRVLPRGRGEEATPGWSEARGELCPSLGKAGPERALTRPRPHSLEQISHHRRDTHHLVGSRQAGKQGLLQGKAGFCLWDLSLQTLSSGQDLWSSLGEEGGASGHLGDYLRRPSGTGSGPWGQQGSLRTLGGAPGSEGGAGAFPPPSFLPPPVPHTAGAGAGQAPWEEALSLAPGPPVQRGRADGQGRGRAWRYKWQPGHRGNELSAQLGSKSLATGALPAPVQPVHSATTTVAMPTAWCSIALALLVALHEGEPLASAAATASGFVCLCLPPGLLCAPSQLRAYRGRHGGRTGLCN